MKSEPALFKSKLRQSMKARLASLSSFEYQEFNRQLQDKFLKLEIVKKSAIVMLYYSVHNEVETVSLIKNLLSQGKTVALPVCAPKRDLKAGAIDRLDQLKPAKYGLMEPGPEATSINPDRLELIVVPGVAFDQRGYRLGHGAGYYDRFLSKTFIAFKLALAYDFQIVPELPVEAHDIKMNGILTPSLYLEFSI